jgi:hypothetical protein
VPPALLEALWKAIDTLATGNASANGVALSIGGSHASRLHHRKTIA